MKATTLVLAGALLLAPMAALADDPYAGWTDQQLKVRAAQLTNQNAELAGVTTQAKVDTTAFDGQTSDQLKADVSKLQDANAALQKKGAPAAAPTVVPAKADLLLDNFEGSTVAGQSWWAGCDNNNLGTTLLPQPFVPETGGCPKSPGHSGRIHGHFGKGIAPWPYAQLVLTLAKGDLRPYSALKFYVKGDGGHYKVELRTPAVKDFAYYASEFDAPKDWTLVTLPLKSFAQPSTWGKAVPADFSAVEKISFAPTANDKDYDFSIDDVTLAK
jgi:hypothetical protein